MVQDETPICPAYTIAPTVNLNNMSSSTILTGANTSFYPQIKVYDNENDNLDCKYYIDGSSTAAGTMTVTGTNPSKVATFTTSFNAAGLAEGAHTIKVTASDNFAKYIGESTVTFYVDKSGPQISTPIVTNSINSIRLDVSATDNISGLAASAYRYTIGGIMTDWLSAKYYTRYDLTPNTPYSYSVEVRDAVGNINKISGNTYTKLDTPVATVTALEGSGIQLVVKDTNPNNTLYRIQVGSQYASSAGTLSTTASWFALTYDSAAGGKKLIITGLSPNTSYSVTVAAINSTGGETVSGGTVSATTAPGVPTNLAAGNITYSNVYLSWSNVSGAVSYELYRQTIASDGSATAPKTISGIISNYYNDLDVAADKTYRYTIRCKNQNGIFGSWSGTPLSVKTLPLPPVKVTGIVVTPDSSYLNASWNSIPGVIGYQAEITYDGSVSNVYVTTNQISFNTGKYDCQCSIKVKGFNVCKGSNLSDHTLWTNEGEWSDKLYYNTAANVPTLNAIDAGQITNNSAVITWNTDSNPDSVRYKLGIYKAGVLDKESIITGIAAGEGKLKYQINGLIPETNYTFKLKAINSAQAESNWSNGISTTTLIDKPAVVTGLRATAKSDRITLLWNNAERAQSYDIERNGTAIATGITSASYVDMDVLPETEYTYKIIAKNVTGFSESSKLEKKTLGKLPAAPTVTSVTGSSISCTVVWTAEEEVTGYDIEANGNVYNVGMNTSYTDNGLIPGSRHEYRVRSRNINGKSGWSEAVLYNTLPNAPEVPVNIAVNAYSTQIQIQWDGVDGAASYDVEIDNTVISGITASEYWYAVTGGDSASQHTIRVRAVNEGGTGGWSAFLTAVLSSEVNIPEISVPAVPEITGSVSGAAIACISWGKVDNATMYQLEADGSVIYTGTGTSYMHAGLDEGSQHIYRVRAGNSGGFSDWSSTVSVTSGIYNSTIPENINYYRLNDSVTAIIWDAVANADGYRIEINGIMQAEVFHDTVAEIATTPGEQYTVRVACVQIGGDTLSDWSDEMVFRAPGALPKAAAIENITAASDAIMLNWSEVVGAYGYEIEFDGQIIDAGNILTYTVTGLEHSASYTVRVRAYNDAGIGSWSEAKTIMTSDGIPGVPVNISGETVTAAGAVTGSAISIKWDAVDNAVSYEVDIDGKIYTADTNSIIINNLIPGERYYFKVRALTDEENGAWSSRSSIVPEVMVPVNVSVISDDGVVHISWDKVGGADYYEVEIDGIIYASTDNTCLDLDSAIFCLQRTIRVRACHGVQKSEWSEKITFNQMLPVTLDVTEGEGFSVILPYKNAEVDNYKITLTYSLEELELLDAFELTPVAELSSTYISLSNTYLIITKKDGTAYISFICNADDGYSWTGIVSSIKFRSKITGSVTLQYSVTEK